MIVLFSIALASTASAGPAASANVSDRRLRDAGWTIDGISLRETGRQGMRRLMVTGRIAAPAWAVWHAVHDSERSSDNWPAIEESIVERADAETTIARYKMSIPAYRDRHYRLRLVADPSRMELAFDLVPGFGNVRAVRGRWAVTPMGESTSRLTYLLVTDPGVRLVPRFLIDWATRKAIPRLYASVHERCMARISPDAAASEAATTRNAPVD